MALHDPVEIFTEVHKIALLKITSRYKVLKVLGKHEAGGEHSGSGPDQRTATYSAMPRTRDLRYCKEQKTHHGNTNPKSY